MAVSDPIFGQKIVAIGIGLFTQQGGVSGVPVDHESARRHSGQDRGTFRSGSGIAGKFILQNQDQSYLAQLLGRLLQLVIHILTIA